MYLLRQRRGIALPSTIVVLVALGLLSALALHDAALAWRGAGYTLDALRAEEGAVYGLLHSDSPPDLHLLCLSAATGAQSSQIVSSNGVKTGISWRHLGAGGVRVEIEGRGVNGGRHRLQLLMVPDSGWSKVAPGCPTSSYLVRVAGKWQFRHPEG